MFVYLFLHLSIKVCVIVVIRCVLPPGDSHCVGVRDNNVSTSFFLLFLFLVSSDPESLARFLSLSSRLCRRRAVGICIRLRHCEWVVSTAGLSSLVPGYIVTAALAASFHGDSGDSPARPSHHSRFRRCSAAHLLPLLLFSKEGKAAAIFNLPSAS